MNHCRDCNSDYATPGTCNCFAPGQKRHLAPVMTPYVPYVPYYPPTINPYPQQPWWGTTITVGDLPNMAETTSFNGAVTTGTVYANVVDGNCPFTWTGALS